MTISPSNWSKCGAVASRSRKNVNAFAWPALLPRFCVRHEARFFFPLGETDNGLTRKGLLNSVHLALRPILHIDIPTEMVHLEFSFDCNIFAFNIRVGSKPYACNIRTTTQIVPIARQDIDNDGAMQTSDPITLTSSIFLDSKQHKTSELLPAKSNLDAVIDPLLLKSSQVSDITNRTTRGLVSPKNLSGAQTTINAGEYLGTKPSQSPPESTANACAQKDTGNSSNDTVQGGIIACTRGFLELPAEILKAAFRELLMTPRTICQAHGLLGTQQAMEMQCSGIKGLEPAILRTCRSIYLQALPILYGNNTFSFNSPASLDKFAYGELNGHFAFQIARYGRLTMIRYVQVELKNGTHQRDYGFGPPPGYQDGLWRQWERTDTPEHHGNTVDLCWK